MPEMEFPIDWISKKEALEIVANFDPTRKPTVRFMHDEIGTIESVRYYDGKVFANLRVTSIPENIWGSIEIDQEPIRLRKLQLMARFNAANIK